MRTSVPIIVVGLLGALSMPAAAQIRLDMNRVTCKDYIGYSFESQNFIRFWMSGYYNAAENSSILNYDRLQSYSALVMTYCKTNKSATLPTAIQKVAQ